MMGECNAAAIGWVPPWVEVPSSSAASEAPPPPHYNHTSTSITTATEDEDDDNVDELEGENEG